MLGMTKIGLKICMTFITSGLQNQLRNVNLYYPKLMKMKNQYEIKKHYIIELENEQLRERIKELVAQINELKRENETKNNREMVQSKGENAIIQE